MSRIAQWSILVVYPLAHYTMTPVKMGLCVSLHQLDQHSKLTPCIQS